MTEYQWLTTTNITDIGRHLKSNPHLISRRKIVLFGKHAFYLQGGELDCTNEADKVTQTHLIRELYGNVFRPPSPLWEGQPDKWQSSRWIGPWGFCFEVNQIAETIDETGDFSAMPILADALEEAGCNDEHILQHCRNKMWVPDETKKTTDRCPVCNARGTWRRGAHFDHEKICMSDAHTHSVVWEPGENYCHRGAWHDLQHPHVEGCWVIDLLTGKNIQ